MAKKKKRSPDINETAFRIVQESTTREKSARPAKKKPKKKKPKKKARRVV